MMYNENKIEIEVLMKDGCTKAEAERHLRRGTIVFTDFEEYFDYHMEELDADEAEIEAHRRMIAEKKPLPDWGIVEHNGKTYYIMYCL